MSDLDIAMEGLNGPSEFFQVLGIAMNATALPVDVVELEKLPADIAERIRTRGVLDVRGAVQPLFLTFLFIKFLILL